MPDRGAVRVTVMYSPAPRKVVECRLELPLASAVLDALRASGIPELQPGTAWRSASVGVWGRKARMEQLLRDGDRVEIYRPLRVDPKLARRERFHKQGSRTAGLFARKQAGTGSG